MIEWEVLHKFLEDGLVELRFSAFEAQDVGLPLVELLLDRELLHRSQELLQGRKILILQRHFANYYNLAITHP
jgi:hypothetical protein